MIQVIENQAMVCVKLWNNLCAGDKISFVLGADLNANRAKYGSSFIL